MEKKKYIQPTTTYYEVNLSPILAGSENINRGEDNSGKLDTNSRFMIIDDSDDE